MDIWLVNPYGPIPGEGWRDYRFTLAGRALARRGHRVTWWTAAFAHQTKEFRSHDWAQRSAGERFTIELVPTPSYPRNIGPGRLWFELVFSRRFFQRAKSLSRPDVIIAADPPQFCGAAGRRLARHFEIPFVIDCLDLWPELFVSAVPAAARPLVRMAALPLFALRRRNVKAADLVIAVAETYRRVITESSSARRSMTIPIGVDVDAIASQPKRDSNDLNGLSLIYAGSLGEHYDLDTVLDVVSAMPEVRLTIAGRGPAEQRLRKRAEMLSNVTFAGAVHADELPNLYAAAGAGLAPYGAGSTVALPLKLFDYLAAGLPVITSLGGEAGELIDDAGAGVRYTPGDAASLRGAISALADPHRRGEMAIAARAAAIRFDARSLYEHYAAAIEAVVRP